MKLWTIQSIAVVNELLKNKSTQADEKLSTYADLREFKIAYKWMANKLNDKYKKPEHIKSNNPIWLWALVDGFDTYRDQDKMFYNRQAGEYALIECEINVNEVLLSDYDAFNSVLNLSYMTDDESEYVNFNERAEEDKVDVFKLFNSDYVRYTNDNKLFNKIMNYRLEVIQSWDKIFDLTNESEFSRYVDKTLQAVTWELRKENVRRIRTITITKDEEEKYVRV